MKRLDGEHRAEGLLADHPHVPVALVQHGRRVEVAVGQRGSSGRRRRSAAPRPRRRPAATYSSTLARCAAEISGPVSRLRVEGPAEPDPLGPAHHLVDEGVVQGVLDEQPGAGRADLAGVQEDRGQREVDGGLEVGVGEDDVGVLAAEFQRDLLHGRRPPAAMMRRPGRQAAGERHHVHVGVLGQRRADLGARRPARGWRRPAGRPASSSRRISMIAVDGVSSLGLSTNVLPAASAGATFQRGLQQRVVPRRDEAAHADRLVDDPADGVVAARCRRPGRPRSRRCRRSSGSRRPRRRRRTRSRRAACRCPATRPGRSPSCPARAGPPPAAAAAPRSRSGVVGQGPSSNAWRARGDRDLGVGPRALRHRGHQSCRRRGNGSPCARPRQDPSSCHPDRDLSRTSRPSELPHDPLRITHWNA